MQDFETLLEQCREKNRMVDLCVQSECSLTGHLDSLKDKRDMNNTVTPLRDDGDFILACSLYVEQRLGGEAAEEAAVALAQRIVNTADHHGGFYSAQAFQGDLLFGELLRMLGYKGNSTPVLSFSHVELGNSTYARGLCLYGSRYKRLLLPIQPKKDENRMVTLTASYDKGALDRVRELAAMPETGVSLRQRKVLDKLLKEVYEDEKLLGISRYADQLFHIGEKLSRHVFSDADRRILYIEGEEVLTPLFISELEDESSLIYRIFYDERLREAMNRISADGLALSQLLLRGADEKGRRINVQLFPDGKIKGMDHRGRVAEYDSGPAELCRLLKARALIPAGFSAAVMLFFERGITWLGGYFQSLYLPEWISLFSQALSEAGFAREASLIASYDGSGYISGPLYALDGGEGAATPAGPAEFYEKPVTVTDLERRLESCMLKDAHCMGLYEIYEDLVPASEKREGWYEAIAEYCTGEYGGYLI